LPETIAVVQATASLKKLRENKMIIINIPFFEFIFIEVEVYDMIILFAKIAKLNYMQHTLYTVFL